MFRAPWAALRLSNTEQGWGPRVRVTGVWRERDRQRTRLGDRRQQDGWLKQKLGVITQGLWNSGGNCRTFFLSPSPDGGLSQLRAEGVELSTCPFFPRRP